MRVNELIALINQRQRSQYPICATQSLRPVASCRSFFRNLVLFLLARPDSESCTWTQSTFGAVITSRPVVIGWEAEFCQISLDLTTALRNPAVMIDLAGFRPLVPCSPGLGRMSTQYRLSAAIKFRTRCMRRVTGPKAQRSCSAERAELPRAPLHNRASELLQPRDRLP